MKVNPAQAQRVMTIIMPAGAMLQPIWNTNPGVSSPKIAAQLPVMITLDAMNHVILSVSTSINVSKIQMAK